MTQNKHKWRVSVYLGKERYQQLEDMAKFFKVPMSQLVRVMIETGFNFAGMMEGGKPNGEQVG